MPPPFWGRKHDMDKKILFWDLDGTLLNDQKEVTSGNRRAMEDALARGHRIVIASGRPLVSALAQAERVGLAGEGCYVIAYNGALLWDCAGKREIYRQSLEPEQVYAVFDEANRRGIHVQSYDGDYVVVEPRCDGENVRRYCGLIHMEYKVVADIRQGLTQPPVKALLIDFQDHDKVAAMAGWIREHLGEAVDCFFSSAYYLEVVPRGVGKGEAVKALCRLLDVPVENAIAAGDEANDVSMLRAAGVGAAMANAVPEAKAAADYVTRRDNNHDGIAEIIGRFMG